MTNQDGSANEDRNDLVQRVALMEAMIQEGRRSTARYGWIFVMWGLLYFAATGWVMLLPHANFAWPVCVAVGVIAGVVVKVRQKQAGAVDGPKSQSIYAVWRVMGAGVTLFAFSAIGAHRSDNVLFIATILFFIGLAHGTSAVILRWATQGAVAAIWGGCGIATMFVTTQTAVLAIFLTASFFGMIVFGVYVMLLERRMPARRMPHPV